MINVTTGRVSHRRKRRLRVSLGATPLFTADVSAGGFSAEILRAPAPGTPVAGTIRVSSGEVRCAGEVVWAKAGAPNLNLHGRIGVRFTTIPGPVAELLAAPVVPGT